MSTVDRYLAPHVLTQDADERWLSPGVVDVADGRIDRVGSPQDVPDRPYAQVHQLSGMLLPGFVNTHAHSPMVLLRGAGEGLPVGRWLAEVMWPREGRLSREDIGWGMRLGAAELLAGGITTSCEMYFRPRVMAAAAREAGLRCLIAPPLLVSEGPNALGTWEQQLDTAAAFAAEQRDDPLIQGVIGPHAAYTVPEAPMREAGRIAAAEGLLLHLHVAEGEHDVAVAHCPNSNGKHASGFAPVTALRAAGVPVAIATDGPASHDRLDAFAEMRAAIRLARLRERDASVLGPVEALRMVTVEAARAIGRNDLGAIEVGRRADLVLVDTEPLRPVVERQDLLTHLVWSGSPALVRSVWVEGLQVVAHGAVTTIDGHRAAAEVTSRAARIAGAS